MTDMRETRIKALVRLLPYALLFFVSVMLYWQTLGFDFIPTWDDEDYILNNRLIRGFSFENLKAIFSKASVGNYAPIHILSYSVDHVFWGMNPVGYHLSNVLLHGINACLVFYLISKLTKNRDMGFISACLFVVHPLNVENLAWVSERKTLLAAMFFFLSFISYLRYREKSSNKAWCVSLVLFAFSVFSKATAVVLPLILVSYELLQGKAKPRWLSFLPYVFISTLGALTTVLAHLGSGASEKGALSFAVIFGNVLPTMITIFWKYFLLVIWPFNLSGYYETTLYTSFLEPLVTASVLGWILVFAMVFLKGSREIRFWFLWFWICMLPSSNIIPLPVYYADRYMYTPEIGLFVIFAYGMKNLMGRNQVIMSAGAVSIDGKKIMYLIFSMVVIFYAYIAYTRSFVWRNELVFWEDTVKKSPGMPKVHLNLGVVYETRGMFREAEQEYIKSLAIYPDWRAETNLRMLRARMRVH